MAQPGAAAAGDSAQAGSQAVQMNGSKRFARLPSAFDAQATAGSVPDVEQPEAEAVVQQGAGAAHGLGANGAAAGAPAASLVRSRSRIRMPSRKVERLAATEDECIIDSMRWAAWVEL